MSGPCAGRAASAKLGIKAASGCCCQIARAQGCGAEALEWGFPIRMMNLKLVEEIQVEASPERVFEAWTSEALLTAWWGNDQFRTTTWQGDVHPGGQWQVRFIDTQGTPYSATGHYELVDRPHRLRFTWSPEWDADPPTVITLDFRPTRTGTMIRLAQEGLATREAFHRNHRAWSETLSMLKQFLARRASAG